MSTQETEDTRRGYSRKSFLGRMGAGAAAVAGAGSLVQAEEALARQARPHAPAAVSQHFGRMFHLGPFAHHTPAVEAALVELGRPGGILDAGDDLARGPVELITDPALSVNNRNNPTHTAGTTFLGQFLDHDMTFDAASPLGVATKPEGARNFRTPAFDLDSVYGHGPVADPQLYEPGDRAKLRIESGGLFEDLPRTGDGHAIIGDPRNDENVIIAGLQCAFIKGHNRAVDDVRSGGTTNPGMAFAEARRLVTWHYHWVILHEFLPQIAGQAMVDEVLGRGRRFYRPDERGAFMPVEFQGAAYRFGHSMVRPSYRANLAGDQGKPFFALIFDPSQEGKPDPADLRGGFRAPRRFVGWQTFFDFGDGQVKPNKRIDTKISTPLFDIPLGVIPPRTPPTSLPQRNLLRHLTWSLPSGQRIARHIGAPVLAPADLAELKPLSGKGVHLDHATPLWYYVLKEAEVIEDGLHLGPVGGRIVAEVIAGLLESDPASYLGAQPRWRPTLPTRTGGPEGFRIVDLLTYAGVDPQSRGQ